MTQTTLSKLHQLISALGASGKLANTSDPTTTAEWPPGLLVQFILANTTQVSIAIALGATDSTNIGIILTPGPPTVAAFDPKDIAEMHAVRKTNISGTPSLRQLLKRAQDDLPLLSRNRGTLYKFTKILAIAPTTVEAYIQQPPLLHPAKLHKLLGEKYKCTNDLLQLQWLQAAATAGTAPTTSCLALANNPPTPTIAAPLLRTIHNDFTELLGPEAPELLATLESDKLLPAAPTPPSSPTPPTAAAAPTGTSATSPIPVDNVLRVPRHTGQATWATTPATQLPTQQAWHAPTTTTTPTTFPGAPPPPDTRTNYVTPQRGNQWNPTHQPETPSLLSLQDKAVRRLNEFFDKPDLTDREWDHIRTVAAIQKFCAPPDAHTTTTTRGHSEQGDTTLIYALIGWSGTHSTEQFHAETDNLWSEFVKTSKKSTREDILWSRLPQLIKRKYPQLSYMRLYPDWVTHVAALNLAPRPFQSSERTGLGPMAYITRTWKELQAIEHQRALNAEASQVSTADIKKSRLSAPAMPDRIHEVIDIVDKQTALLKCLFTDNCPLALQLDKVLFALKQYGSSLANIPNFQWDVAAEILWQLSLATTEFFDHRTVLPDLQRNFRPTADLAWLVTEIRTGRISQAGHKPEMFMAPTPSHQPTQSTKRNRPPPTNPKPTQAARKAALTKQLPQKCMAILTNYKKDNKRFPSIASVRRKVDAKSDDDLITKLGLRKNDCIRYNVYGECPFPDCPHVHDDKQTLKIDHAGLLAKALSKG